MYILLFIIGGLICVGALFATISAGKEVNHTIESQKKAEEDAKKKGLPKAQTNEKRPFGNIPTLLLVYGLSFFAGVLILVLCIILFF